MELTTNIAQKYSEVRKKTMELVSPLMPEDFIPQPIIDVSPPKWNLGHTTWFFETFILKAHNPNYKVFDTNFNFVFNSYYETIGERVLRDQRGNLSRPELKKVFAYREYVDKHIKSFLSEGNYDEDVLNLLELGINHEQQHQELFITDFKYILYSNPLKPAYTQINKDLSKPPSSLNFNEIDEDVYPIGYNGPNFHFDNEEGEHKVYLQEFSIANRLITNAEYLEFMKAGAYDKFNFWLAEGWDWLHKNNIQSPEYWFIKNGEWHYYTLGGCMPVDMNEPVTHVSFYEADAFARWSGNRLATEFEWEVACRHFANEIKPENNFLDAQHFHPIAQENNANQLLGDTWEWTNSAYLPYPKFKIAEGAVGEYNGKFMVNQMVLRGGSCATPANHFRITYRNFFHPDKRWQFTGIRLAK
ncbi:MAG: ergothioneine biosynthesis protein EgtB [Bacteroidia bacterium]|nr:ergothioneine biosynthesis protein EgtB [Bacteroidia bacterium]